MKVCCLPTLETVALPLGKAIYREFGYMVSLLIMVMGYNSCTGNFKAGVNTSYPLYNRKIFFLAVNKWLDRVKCEASSLFCPSIFEQLEAVTRELCRSGAEC